MTTLIKRHIPALAILSIILGVLSFILVRNYKEEISYRKYAYFYAQWCLDTTVGRSNGNPYDSIKVKIIRGNQIYVASNDFGQVRIFQSKGQLERSGLTDGFEAVAYYLREENTIYVASKYRMDTDVLSHEYVHALGLHGHDNPVFHRCYLAAEQIAEKY